MVVSGVWSAKSAVWRVQCEVCSVECADCQLWSVKWSFKCDMWNTTSVSQSARTHGLGWRTAHASSIDEKGVIYIFKATSAPPRAGTTGIYIGPGLGPGGFAFREPFANLSRISRLKNDISETKCLCKGYVHQTTVNSYFFKTWKKARKMQKKWKNQKANQQNPKNTKAK